MSLVNWGIEWYGRILNKKCCSIWHVPWIHLVLPWSSPLQTCVRPPSSILFPFLQILVSIDLDYRNQIISPRNFSSPHDLPHLCKCFRDGIFCSLFGANLTSVVLLGKCTWFLTRAFQNVTLLICWIMKSKLFHKKRCNYTACNTQINWLNVTL